MVVELELDSEFNLTATAGLTHIKLTREEEKTFVRWMSIGFLGERLE